MQYRKYVLAVLEDAGMGVVDSNHNPYSIDATREFAAIYSKQSFKAFFVFDVTEMKDAPIGLDYETPVSIFIHGAEYLPNPVEWLDKQIANDEAELKEIELRHQLLAARLDRNRRLLEKEQP